MTNVSICTWQFPNEMSLQHTISSIDHNKAIVLNRTENRKAISYKNIILSQHDHRSKGSWISDKIGRNSNSVFFYGRRKKTINNSYRFRLIVRKCIFRFADVIGVLQKPIRMDTNRRKKRLSILECFDSGNMF